MKRKLIIHAIIIAAAVATAILFWPKQKPAVHLKVVPFAKLPGWETANVKQSFHAFQKSCRLFLKRQPETKVGSQQIHLQAKDWQPACQAAMKIDKVTTGNARGFFQTWFKPVEFYDSKPVDGLFTGYYLPLLHGSYEKTAEYNVPIYGMPNNIVTINPGDFSPNFIAHRIIARVEKGKVLPFYTRAEINHGAIDGKAPVLVWVNSPIDRLYLEIQGSGVVKLPNGDKLYLGYAGENGAAYTPVGKVLVDKGIMTKKTASMQSIRAYLEAHPQEIDEVLNKNKSFVFFRVLNQTAAVGAQNIELTPGYSLAVDRKWIPLGTPLWLDTTHPDENEHSDTLHALQRLMIAQDTGGAIRGAVRGDVFWGAGKRATNIAGLMKNPGHYWLLLPRHTIKHLPKELA